MDYLGIFTIDMKKHYGYYGQEWEIYRRILFPSFWVAKPEMAAKCLPKPNVIDNSVNSRETPSPSLCTTLEERNLRGGFPLQGSTECQKSEQSRFRPCSIIQMQKKSLETRGRGNMLLRRDLLLFACSVCLAMTHKFDRFFSRSFLYLDSYLDSKSLDIFTLKSHRLYITSSQRVLPFRRFTRRPHFVVVIRHLQISR